MPTAEANRVEEIKALHEQFDGPEWKLHATRIGELLLEQKRESKRTFKKWVKDNFEFSHRTATDWMKLFRYRNHTKVEESSTLSGAIEAAHKCGKKRKRKKQPKQDAGPPPDERKFTLKLTKDEEEELLNLIGWVAEKVFETENPKATVFAALQYAKERHGG